MPRLSTGEATVFENGKQILKIHLQHPVTTQRRARDGQGDLIQSAKLIRHSNRAVLVAVHW